MTVSRNVFVGGRNLPRFHASSAKPTRIACMTEKRALCKDFSIHIEHSFQIIAGVNTKGDKGLGLYNALYFEELICDKFFQVFIVLAPD